MAKASRVPLRSSDFKVVARVRLKVWDDCLSQASIHLHFLTVIFNLKGGKELVKLIFMLCAV